jgi:ribonucleoside-diphosphate reductase beta chain
VTYSRSRLALRTDSLPTKLYEQAKEDSDWNPSRLDFSTDRAHWDSLGGQDRLPILALSVLISHGLRIQYQVSSSLMAAVEQRGSIEESLCYSSIVFETAKHLELYGVLLEDVLYLVGDPERFHQKRFRSWMDTHMLDALERHRASNSDDTLVETLTLSGPIFKGVLANTSNVVFHRMLERLEIMPTIQSSLERQHRNLTRHTQFASYFIGQMVRRDPRLWEIADETMQSSFDLSVGMIREFHDRYDRNVVSRAEAVTYAVEQFSSNYEALELARHPDNSLRRAGA